MTETEATNGAVPEVAEAALTEHAEAALTEHAECEENNSDEKRDEESLARVEGSAASLELGEDSPVQSTEAFEEVELQSGLAELDGAFKRGDPEAIRACFTNLTRTFPTANVIWYSWAQHELLAGNFEQLERVFTRCLKSNLSVPLWRLYLSYVRNYQLSRIQDESEARQTMLKAYDFAVAHVGMDVASGPIWAEYIDFVQQNHHQLQRERTASYEQQQLMDLTRKIYHRALSTPMEGLESLWHAYDAYENGLNKLTAKKLVSERSSAYMASRSATRELLDLVGEIDLDACAVDPRRDLTETMRRETLASWLRWIDWEKRNVLGTGDRSLVHARVVYAYRRALMATRRDPLMWLSYLAYLRFDAGRLAETELVLRQALRVCPLSSGIVFAAVDVKEAQGMELETVRRPLDEYLVAAEARLDALKREIVESHRSPADNDDEAVFAGAVLERRGPQVVAYLALRDEYNAAQVQLLDLARRLGGLSAARGVFAAGRKSLHALAAVFSAAASLEFRIRKDPSIAIKIYELGLSRFPTDWAYAREYLAFLLLQNDDSNVRALFERVVANLEAFRSSHSRDVVAANERHETVVGLWTDFYAFERRIGDHHSIQRLEERMRAAFPDEPAFKPGAFFNGRFDVPAVEDFVGAGESEPQTGFHMARVREEKHVTPFHLPEALINMFVLVRGAVGAEEAYDGPRIDTGRFLSFIERVTLPAVSTNRRSDPRDLRESREMREVREMRSQDSSGRRRPMRPSVGHTSTSGLRRRRQRDSDSEDEHGRDAKQLRAGSSIFEDRRRY